MGTQVQGEIHPKPLIRKDLGSFLGLCWGGNFGLDNYCAQQAENPGTSPKRRTRQVPGDWTGSQSTYDESERVMSEEVRRSAWLCLLETERQVRYYTKLLQKQRRWQAYVDNGLGVLGGLAIASLLAPFWPSAPAVFGGLVGALSVYGRIAKHGEKAECLESIRRDCEALQNRSMHLWRSIQSRLATEQDALDRILDLEEKLRISTGRASEARIMVDEDANREAWNEAREIRVGEYPTS